MPVVSADTLQLSHVLETTPGTTPANPAFQIWRTTGESLVFAPQTSDSGELGGAGRFQKPSTVTGTSISGDISFELAKFPALEQAMAGVFAGNWGQCPLTGTVGGGIDDNQRITVGKTLQTFTIEKRFPNPAYVSGMVASAPQILAAAFGAQTLDLTLTQTGAASGTGLVVVDIQVTGGTNHHVTVPIDVGDNLSDITTKLVNVIDALPDVSATAGAAGTVTVDSGTGNTLANGSIRAGNDEFFYQRFKGASYNTLSISVAPNAPITGSVGIVGGAPELDVVPITGATYVSAGNNPTFTAPQVMELSVGTSMGIGTHCWTSLNINIDSQNRGIACIGTQGDREVVLGTLSASVSGDVYFSDQAIIQALLDNATIGNSVITFADANGNLYRWDFFGMKPTSGQISAGGAGQDLTIPLTLQPTPIAVCRDANNNGWDSGFILSTKDIAPTLP